MKTVFILGAGASKSAGAPLMNEFLDQARYLHRARTASIEYSSFDLVLQALSDLQRVRQKSSLDLENVESVFSAVEMGDLIGKFPGREADHIPNLRDALVTVIVQTIEQSMGFPVRDGSVLAPGDYRQFADLVQNLIRPGNLGLKRDVSILTFNYDVGVDYALHRRGIPFAYWLQEEDVRTNAVPLLKLHGAINWGLCKVCGKVIPFQVREVHFGPLSETQRVYFDLGTKLPKIKHCDSPLSGTPILVPPTWDKSGYQKQVAEVWKKAAAELSQAENIFVIGYSLPDTDSFFRYLFAVASESRTLVNRFWVFNPDGDGSVRPRFEHFIGPSITPKFRFFPGDSGLFINAISSISLTLSQGL